jgi:hypothetical protein
VVVCLISAMMTDELLPDMIMSTSETIHFLLALAVTDPTVTSRNAVSHAGQW